MPAGEDRCRRIGAAARAKALAAYAVGHTAGKVFHGAGLRQLGQAVSDFGSTARAIERNPQSIIRGR